MNQSIGATVGVIAAVIGALLLVLFLVWRILYYVEEMRHIRLQLNRACHEDERRYWRRMRTYCRLRLIPFVTHRNVSTVYACFCRSSNPQKHGGAHAPRH